MNSEYRSRTAERHTQMSQKAESTRVSIKFYASLRESLGVKEIILNLNEDSSLASALEKLKDTIGDKTDAVISREGKIRNVLLSVNGRLVDPENLANLILQDRDEVDVMPLPSGG